MVTIQQAVCHDGGDFMQGNRVKAQYEVDSPSRHSRAGGNPYAGQDYAQMDPRLRGDDLYLSPPFSLHPIALR